MSKVEYTVVGQHAYRGNRPGSSFKAEPSAALERAVARQQLTVGKAAENLEALSRDELNELAATAGVQAPEELSNKAEVVDAIRAANSEE